MDRKIDSYYNPSTGSPLKCFNCGSAHLQDRNIVTIDTYGHICEFEKFCLDCDEPVGYWAYGNWDPHSMEHVNNELHRNALRTIEIFLGVPESAVWIYKRKLVTEK